MSLPEKKVRDVAYERAMNLVEKDRNASAWEPSFFLSAEAIKDSGSIQPAGWIGHFTVSTGLDGQ